MNDNRPPPPGLQSFWNNTVQAFTTLPDPEIADGMKERHRMYSLLLMSLIWKQWNGNKYGEIGDYGTWRKNQELITLPNGQKVYAGGTHLGYNIAAIAVDAEGRIMDFDFNHNDIFDSSVEHAESRLVRRIFALNQVYAPWSEAPNPKIDSTPNFSLHKLHHRQKRNLFATAISHSDSFNANQSIPEQKQYGNLLKDVTIYTSLESCAQCSGIMCLASVKEIVYLQWDQGQFLIGNMMWQATTTQKSGFRAPRPIRGDEFGFEYFSQLNSANDEFSTKVANSPFYVGSDGKIINTPSVTSFLCTDTALGIYEKAKNELYNLSGCNFPEYQPIPSALTNAQVLEEVHDYIEWISKLNNRGTPHRV